MSQSLRLPLLKSAYFAIKEVALGASDAKKTKCDALERLRRFVPFN